MVIVMAGVEEGGGGWVTHREREDLDCVCILGGKSELGFETWTTIWFDNYIW